MLVALLEFALVLVLVVVNGLFAMSEIAVVSARRRRLQQRADDGDERARAALALKAEPTQFLSAVQIGISLVGVLAGAFGGARLARHFEEPLRAVPWIGEYADTVAFVLVVTVVTYLSVVVGELVPKRIAMRDPERVASRIAGPMQKLATVAAPLVALLTASTNLVSRLLGVGGRRREEDDEDATVSERQIRDLIAQGARRGVVHAVEEDLLERVFSLDDRPASAVMTPRVDVHWVDAGGSRAALREAVARARHPSLLVCDGALDRVLGVAPATRLLAACLDDAPLDLRAHVDPPLRVPASISLLDLLERMERESHRLAVIDEARDGARGEPRVAGVVTRADILRDLTALMPGSGGIAGEDVEYCDDGSWSIAGRVPVRAAERALGGRLLPLDVTRERTTVADALAGALGRAPHDGDAVSLGDYRAEVRATSDGRLRARLRAPA